MPQGRAVTESALNVLVGDLVPDATVAFATVGATTPGLEGGGDGGGGPEATSARTASALSIGSAGGAAAPSASSGGSAAATRNAAGLKRGVGAARPEPAGGRGMPT